MLYAGQPYLYNFIELNDVEPRYNDIPYTVQFAKGYNNPEWLRIEDNKLIADKVPNNLDQNQNIYITIKNIPGGTSAVLPLSFIIME